MATRRGPDNSIRWVVTSIEQSVVMANVFWAQTTATGTPSQSDLDTWLTTASNAYKTNFLPHISNTVTMQQAQAQMFLPGNGLATSLIAMTGTGSGGSGVGGSQAASSVLSWQINDYYRGGKPRTYLPFTPPGLTQNNQELTSAEQTALATAAAAFRTAINAITSTAIPASQLGTVSFRRGGVELSPPVFKPYLSVKVHPRLGTQRHRLGKWRP